MERKYIAIGVLLGIAISSLTLGVSLALYHPQEAQIQHTNIIRSESSVRIEQV